MYQYFVYVIDDLERFGRSIGNTGKWNGVMVLRSIYRLQHRNTMVACVCRFVCKPYRLLFPIGDMPADHGYLKMHGAVTCHLCFKFPSISGFTYDGVKGSGFTLGSLVQAKPVVTQRLVQTVGSPL
jgi:hypothetical protein